MRLRYATLVEMVTDPAAKAKFTFIGEDDSIEEVFLRELAQEARRLASVLCARGIRADDRVPVIAARNRDFIVGLMAVLMARGVPCPLPPPNALARVEEAAPRMRQILTYLRTNLVIAGAATATEALSAFRGLEIVDPAERGAELVRLATPNQEETAAIQCTSGSTGMPKGVMLSHRNLLANMHQIGLMAQVTAHDVGVSWLPMNHDMGLIGSLLTSMYWGLHLVMMPSMKFLRRPISWLRAISQFKATHSPAPNFAYEYAASRIRDDELSNIDLATWRVAFCGSEAISAATMARFVRRFAPYGLRKDVAVPCYGLAECALIVTGETVGEPLRVDRPTGAGNDLVSCGQPVEETQVRILDAQGQLAPEGSIGRIVVSGPSVMQGYFDLPELSRRTVQDGWLDTGDLGYLKEGRLYVSGRAKDCIILRGQCFAPSMFEWFAEEVDGVRSGGVAAIGITDPELGTEVLHLVCETRVQGHPERQNLETEIRAIVGSRSGVVPGVVHLVRPGTVPRTTSGKVRRKEVRSWIEQGRLRLSAQTTRTGAMPNE